MTTSAGIALVLALGSAALAPAATGARAVPAASAAPALSWSACGDATLGQECATLTVPLDHAHPAGPQVGLAVSRIRSAEPAARRGVLFVVPGGPGGSGVQRL